jgi:hypothetical protein
MQERVSKRIMPQQLRQANTFNYVYKSVAIAGKGHFEKLPEARSAARGRGSRWAMFTGAHLAFIGTPAGAISFFSRYYGAFFQCNPKLACTASLAAVDQRSCQCREIFLQS